MPPFQIVTDFTPQGDQPQAIEKLSEGVVQGEKHQVLLGVTGSGKTFSMAHIIERVQKPTLVIAPNKALAAQLYGEFKELFPSNAVEYFVSYYDYYQPEAYLPTTDTYIAKDASINDTIDKMRHSATHSLFERRDVIIVASVSCIYGLGSPEEYKNMLVLFQNQVEAARDEILSRLVEIQYERNDYDFARGTFRVRGDVIEIFPAYEEERAEFLVRNGSLIEKEEKLTRFESDLMGIIKGEVPVGEEEAPCPPRHRASRMAISNPTFPLKDGHRGQDNRSRSGPRRCDGGAADRGARAGGRGRARRHPGRCAPGQGPGSVGVGTRGGF